MSQVPTEGVTGSTEDATAVASAPATSAAPDMVQDHCSHLERIIGCLSSLPANLSSSSEADFCRPKWQMNTCIPGASLGENVRAACTFGITVYPGGVAIQDDHPGEIWDHCNASTRDWNDAKLQTCVVRIPSNDDDVTNDVVAPHTAGYHHRQDSDSDEQRQQQLVLRIYTTLQTLTTGGYALSLVSLIVAIFLFSAFRKLHCMRVTIHINLMVSFLLRTILWYLHYPAIPGSVRPDAMGRVFIEPQYHGDLALIQDLHQQLCAPKTYSWCRLHTILLHYIIVANYFWTLIEGVYLWILLQAFHLPTGKTMILFLLFGWGCPWIPVAVYTSQVGRDSSDGGGAGCWDVTDCQSPLFWIIKTPIVVSLLINFVFFVMVLKIVASKLRFTNRADALGSNGSNNGAANSYKWRLTKATLSLVPLLGISYLLTTFVQCNQYSNAAVMVVKYLELFYVSVQGFLIAVIYCFMNSEIKEELLKLQRSWRLKKELGRIRSSQDTRTGGCGGGHGRSGTYGYYQQQGHSNVTHLTSVDGAAAISLVPLPSPGGAKRSPNQQRLRDSKQDDVSSDRVPSAASPVTSSRRQPPPNEKSRLTAAP